MTTPSKSPVRRPVLRYLAACAAVAAWSAPVRAQASADMADAWKPADVVRLAGAPRAPEVVRLSTPLKPFEAPKSIDAAKPFAAWTESVHSLRDSILVSVARTQIGTRYVRGGQSPLRGFDCSGLVRYVLGGLNIPLPRTAAEQAQVGLALGRDTTRLRPGDLLTFGKPKRGVSHVGIYMGNGRFIHASSAAGRVIESDLARPMSPLIRPWKGTRRVVFDGDDDPTVKGDS
jgi:cell wall-associated NlpC family hydrolase